MNPDDDLVKLITSKLNAGEAIRIDSLATHFSNGLQSVYDTSKAFTPPCNSLTMNTTGTVSVDGMKASLASVMEALKSIPKPAPTPNVIIKHGDTIYAINQPATPQIHLSEPLVGTPYLDLEAEVRPLPMFYGLLGRGSVIGGSSHMSAEPIKPPEPPPEPEKTPGQIAAEQRAKGRVGRSVSL